MKRNIAYVKPQDPSFLAKLKSQIGYQDTQANLDAKRQRTASDSAEDFDSDREDERPQIVSPDGAEQIPEEVVRRIFSEKTDEKANLEQPIVFKSKANRRKSDRSSDGKASKVKKSQERTKSRTNKLSFNPDEDEDADGEPE